MATGAVTVAETAREGVADDGTVTWRQVAADAAARLAAAGSPSPEVDARRLIEEVTGAEGIEVYDVLDERATERRLARFDAMLTRRLAGEPLQYVLGRWGFRRLDLLVDQRVLIPRPETEQVVEVALREVDRLVRHLGTTYGDRLAVADLGTGSGAIALAMASEQPLIDVWATDVSPDALAVARANLAGIGRAGARVRLSEGHWFAALPGELRGRLSVVVSNPPYVAETDPLPVEVADWEPRGALVPGPTGLEALDEVVGEAAAWLSPGGALVVELAPDQAGEVAARARAAGFGEVATHPDLTGRPRAVVARVPGG
jgi:release factor glutamine methyltransferase